MAQRRGAQAGLSSYSVFSFAGVDVKTSALKRAVAPRQDALLKGRNCVLTTAGAVSRRLDATVATTTLLGGLNTIPQVITGGLGAFTALTDTRFLPTRGFLNTGHEAAITGGWHFVKSDGTQFIVFGATDGAVYTLNANGSTTVIDSGHTPGTKWYFTQYNDKLIFCNRVDAVRKWDGTTVADLGGTPPTAGGPFAVHGNRVFMLDGVNKSRLSWSALDNEEDWTTADNAGNVDVSKNDGSDLVALVPSVNELVLLKGRRPYRLQGTSPATFAITNLVPTTGSVGAESPRAALFALNDVWYVASPGIVRLTAVQGFGDLRESFPSAPIQPYFERDTDFTLTLQHLGDAVMVYDSQANRIYIGVDSDDDGQNDTMLVYDAAGKGWTTWDGLSIASLWTVKNTLTGQTDVYMGGYDGRIRVLNRNVAVTAIPAEARHLSALGQPGVEKSVRHLFLYFKEQGATTVTVDTRFDFGATGGQTYIASLLGGSKVLGVNWVLGVDPLGAQDQIVKRVNVHGRGEFMEVGVTNTDPGQPWTWYGYEALYRPERIVRRGTGVAA